MGNRGYKATAKYSCSQEALDLFSDLATKGYSNYLPEAQKLKKTKNLSKSINNIEIQFRVKGKYVATNYLLPNGESVATNTKFNSVFANNNAISELVLELARAEANAKLTENGDKFKLYEFPSFGYITTSSEKKSVNYRLRQLLKRPVFI